MLVVLLDHDQRPDSASTIGSCRTTSKPFARNSKQTSSDVSARDRLRQAVGDLNDGLVQVAMYFLIAALIAALIIFGYTRCVRSTALVIACSLIAVVWQLGIVAALGFSIVFDPRAFLVFAIGVSTRAENERHHAGHRPRRAPPRGRALHVPTLIPRRPYCAAGRRGRLCGADGDRHSRDQGPGADRQSALRC
jgi:hypothetical protein